MQFDIEPHRGVGPISFGMPRLEVSEIMACFGGGPPNRKSRNTDCYLGNAFQPSFNKDRRVEFIGVSNNCDHVFTFNGVDVFDVPADQLLEHALQFDQPDPELSRAGYEYTFPQLILTLWEINAQYDHKGGQKRPVFAEVGVGTAGYLEAIRALKRRRPKPDKPAPPPSYWRASGGGTSGGTENPTS